MKAVNGLDGYKDPIFACILQKGIDPFIKEYSTLTYRAKELSNYLQALEVNMFATKTGHLNHFWTVKLY